MTTKKSGSQRSIVAFIHTYQADGKFDPYMESVIHAFKDAGFKLYVIKTNDLVEHLWATRIKRSVSEKKLIAFINDINPLFIFSTNRGGISQGVLAQTKSPIITRMVDLIPFTHHGGTDHALFCDRDLVFVPTQESVNAFEKRYPVLKGKVYYLPFATDPDSFDAAKDVDKDIPVSFVGTYFYCEQLTKILKTLQHGNHKKLDLFLRFVRDLKDDFHIENKLLDVDLQALCHDLNMSLDDMRMLVSNGYALNKRIRYLDAIADMGLQLFGTDNWIQANQYSLPLLSCFQFDERIDDRESLIRLYQRSKIALNIPHHQAGPGMPYRVYDIMASSALLITEYHADSELYALFGKEMPIPMYRNAEDLRRLVEYYLEHEEERLEIVAKCNALIREKKLTFQDRARAYGAAVGVDTRLNQAGLVEYVDQYKFLIPFSWLLPSRRKIIGRIKVIAGWLIPHRLWEWLVEMRR